MTQASLRNCTDWQNPRSSHLQRMDKVKHTFTNLALLALDDRGGLERWSLCIKGVGFALLILSHFS